MSNCKECGKPLKSIGTARKNGKKTHGDWATREYHKKCFKEKQKSFLISQTVSGLELGQTINKRGYQGWGLGKE